MIKLQYKFWISRWEWTPWSKIPHVYWSVSLLGGISAVYKSWKRDNWNNWEIGKSIFGMSLDSVLGTFPPGWFFFLSFFFFAVLQGLRDLSSLTRDQTCAPAVEAQSPHHWTAREYPSWLVLICILSMKQSITVSITAFNVFFKSLANHLMWGWSWGPLNSTVDDGDFLDYALHLQLHILSWSTIFPTKIVNNSQTLFWRTCLLQSANKCTLKIRVYVQVKP